MGRLNEAGRRVERPLGAFNDLVSHGSNVGGKVIPRDLKRGGKIKSAESGFVLQVFHLIRPRLALIKAASLSLLYLIRGIILINRIS